ncbi:hypothetical protein OESDEN_10208, partial [Oesophagostomum dentatum]
SFFFAFFCFFVLSYDVIHLHRIYSPTMASLILCLGAKKTLEWCETNLPGFWTRRLFRLRPLLQLQALLPDAFHQYLLYLVIGRGYTFAMGLSATGVESIL